MLWQCFANEATLYLDAPARSIPLYVVALPTAGALTLAVLVVLFFGRSRRMGDG